MKHQTSNSDRPSAKHRGEPRPTPHEQGGSEEGAMMRLSAETQTVKFVALDSA